MFDETGMDGRKAADGPTELLARVRVVNSGFVRALRQPDCQRGNADASGVEDLQRLNESLPFLADELLRRNPAVLKDHFGGLAGTHAELVFLLPCHQPGCP